MIDKIADKLVDIQRQKNNIAEEDEKIYHYGYILLMELIINICIALIIGIAFSETKNILFFLVMYIPLRSFCGGWHADKIWKCTLISNLILLIQILFLNTMAEIFSMFYMLVFCLFCMLFVSVKAPIDTANKKISLDEKQKYKKIIRIIILIHLIIMSLSIVFNFTDWVFCMMFVYFVQSTMLLLEICNKTKT